MTIKDHRQLYQAIETVVRSSELSTPILVGFFIVDADEGVSVHKIARTATAAGRAPISSDHALFAAAHLTKHVLEEIGDIP